MPLCQGAFPYFSAGLNHAAFCFVRDIMVLSVSEQLVRHFPFILNFPRKPHYNWDHKISHVSTVLEWRDASG